VDDRPVASRDACPPHRSIAILTSERAALSDPRVRELPDEIIQSQRREIVEMNALIGELETEQRRYLARGGQVRACVHGAAPEIASSREVVAPVCLPPFATYMAGHVQ